MATGKTLSVIVPNFNDVDYLATQLKAICEQSFPPLEVIVVDDGSTDSSVACIKELAAQYPAIHLVCNDKNQGVNYCINRGAKLATGDYIYFSSANDLVYPGFFEKSMTLLAEYPEAGLCCADVRILDEVQGITFDHLKTNWLASAGYLSPLQFVDVTSLGKGLYAPVSNACVIRRALLPNEDIYISKLECFSDWFLYQVIALRYGCCFIPEVLAGVRVLKKSYGQSVLNDRVLCGRVFMETLKLLATSEYKDVSELMITGRSLRVFRTYVRNPIAASRAVGAMSMQNDQARALLCHVNFEYFRQVCIRTAKLFAAGKLEPAVAKNLS